MSLSLEGIDEDTALLAIRFYLDDLNDLGSPFPDANTKALAALLQENLEDVRSTINDRRMARSIAAAVTGDGTVVTACAREEQIARHDHTLAQRLRNGNDIANAAVPAAEPPSIDDTTLSRLAGLFVSAHAGRAILYKDALGRGTKRRRDGEEVRPDGNRDCVACGDSKAFFDLLSVACGHEYCGECLTELFEKSYKDESMFPPRCCRQTISVAGHDIKPFLSKNLRDKYEPRRVEIATKDRTYCFNKTCSTFIPPTAIQSKVALCSKCTCRTCTDCKRAAHLGICAEDQDEQLTIDLARQEGWQRCSSCRRMVELTLGCYHMTCPCNAEFCYRCGQSWKTCVCPQWDENRLLARATVVVERENVRVNPAPEAQQQQVRRMMEELREDHECTHEDWERIEGEHECENCNDTLRGFILRCEQCHIQCRDGLILTIIKDIGEE